MTTARSIIKSAMRKAGILTKTEEPSADEAADGLEMLNDLMDSWSNDSMVIYSRSLEPFTLVANQREYTIGPGADFNTPRPVRIIAAYVRVGGLDYSLQIIEDETYAGITFKNTGSIPEFLNFTNAFPVATIKLWPFPPAGYELFLLTEKQLETFTLDEVISLPPGWKRALIHNLAVELSPEYGQELPASVIEIAKDSKAQIRSSIMTARSMDYLPGPGSMGNIYNGWYWG